MSTLEGRSILVGVTGGIACYKAAELVRSLKKAGAQVRVMMTRSACEFVTPLTFQTLSQNPVATELFAPISSWEIEHIALARAADTVVVAPATANVIGKTANGIADDLVTTVIMATRAPVVFCPAMNVAMWENPIVQSNIQRLRELGYRFVEPGEGDLACGEEGKGRMAEVERIVEALEELRGHHA